MMSNTSLAFFFLGKGAGFVLSTRLLGVAFIGTLTLGGDAGGKGFHAGFKSQNWHMFILKAA